MYGTLSDKLMRKARNTDHEGKKEEGGGGALFICFDMPDLTAICTLPLGTRTFRWCRSRGRRRTRRIDRVAITITFLLFTSTPTILVPFKSTDFRCDP